MGEIRTVSCGLQPTDLAIELDAAAAVVAGKPHAPDVFGPNTTHSYVRAASVAFPQQAPRLFTDTRLAALTTSLRWGVRCTYDA